MRPIQSPTPTPPPLRPRRRGPGRPATLATLATLMAFGAVGAFALSSCGALYRSGNALVIYNGQHLQTTMALVDAFEKATGVDVTVRSDDEDVLADQLSEEGRASTADIVVTENSPALQRLQEEGLLAPVDASTLARVPARYDSPVQRWVGVTARVSVLVYNTDALRPDQLPTNVLQLADPRWRGRLGIAPSETDLLPVIASVQHAYGTARTLSWLEGMKANAGAQVYPDNESLVDAVNRGRVDLALIDHYYWYRERVQVGAAAMRSALAYFAPADPGYVVDVSGAAVLQSSHHLAAAQRFLAFMVSPQGQRIIADSDSYEYPLATGAPGPSGPPPLRSLRPTTLSIAALGDGATPLALLEQAQLL